MLLLSVGRGARAAPAPVRDGLRVPNSAALVDAAVGAGGRDLPQEEAQTAGSERTPNPERPRVDSAEPRRASKEGASKDGASKESASKEGPSKESPNQLDSGVRVRERVPRDEATLASLGGTGAATEVEAARIPELVVEGLAFEDGEIPAARVSLDRLRPELARCVADDGARRWTDGPTAPPRTVRLRFIVRSPGRAEGVDIAQARGLSAEAARCVALVVKNRHIGAPSSEPVSVELTLRLRFAQVPVAVRTASADSGSAPEKRARTERDHRHPRPHKFKKNRKSGN